MDVNHDGVVTREEFLECCRRDHNISMSMAVFDSTIWPADGDCNDRDSPKSYLGGATTISTDQCNCQNKFLKNGSPLSTNAQNMNAVGHTCLKCSKRQAESDKQPDYHQYQSKCGNKKTNFSSGKSNNDTKIKKLRMESSGSTASASTSLNDKCMPTVPGKRTLNYSISSSGQSTHNSDMNVSHSPLWHTGQKHQHFNHGMTSGGPVSITSVASGSQSSKKSKDSFIGTNMDSNNVQRVNSRSNEPVQQLSIQHLSTMPTPGSPHSGGGSSQNENSPILVRVKAWYAVPQNSSRMSCWE